MRTHIVERSAFLVAGVTVATSQTTQAADAGPVAARFFAPGFADSIRGRIDPTATYAVHADFNPDGETYRLILGFEVEAADQPAGIHIETIPAGRYTVFTAVGVQPQASIDAWEEIKGWRGRADVVRTGEVSFEVHDARSRQPVPEADIYIPAVIA